MTVDFEPAIGIDRRILLQQKNSHLRRGIGDHQRGRPTSS